MSVDTPSRLHARRTIESLRSGVPGRQAVSQLGTTQRAIAKTFEETLQALRDGKGTKPMVISAGFGSGKTHLLEYLQGVAEQAGFVTSYVVVSPEMPLGNPHVVLKAIAEAAVAPGRVGCAMQALAEVLGSQVPLSEVRAWAASHGLDGRFPALVHIYEQFRADEELRCQILDDLQGRPLNKAVVKQKLKEIGEAATYAMSRTRNALLAHDRISIMAQCFRSAGAAGWIVLFDEVERVARFSLKQRTAAYEELGWWNEQAGTEGAALLPVFTMTAGFLQETVTGGANDAQRLDVASLESAPRGPQRHLYQGIALLKSARELDLTTPAQERDIARRIQDLYQHAYPVQVADAAFDPSDAWLPLRARIRKWITQWDLTRYDPSYVPTVMTTAVEFDTDTIDDAALPADDE